MFEIFLCALTIDYSSSLFHFLEFTLHFTWVIKCQDSLNEKEQLVINFDLISLS